jgi:3-hydroxyisobutyrate dehydrogenase
MALRAGFVGLGHIGGPMAGRLVEAGLDTSVFDVRAEAAAPFVEKGARAAASARELAAPSDVVGVCVRDDADVRAVLTGPEGLLAGARPGLVVAVHSTVLPGTIRALGAEAAGREVALLDACVTGGPAGAAQGTLVVMAGGEEAALAKARPYLDAFARQVVHAGPLGSGAAIKLCNNLMTYLGFLSAFEATLLAREAGLSVEAFEAVTRSNGNLTDQMRAFLALHRAPEETRRSESFQGMLRGVTTLAEKDLAATLAYARELGLALPGAGLCAQLMARVYGLDDPGRR